jgi:hypothetical protein
MDPITKEILKRESEAKALSSKNNSSNIIRAIRRLFLI